MFGMQALKTLFQRSGDGQPTSGVGVDELIAEGTVGILSAACCDAMSGQKDEQLAEHLTRALQLAGSTRPVVFATLTATRTQLRQAGTGAAAGFRDELAALFQAQGLAAFPMLVVDGHIAFYGGAPSPETIAQKLGSAA